MVIKVVTEMLNLNDINKKKKSLLNFLKWLSSLLELNKKIYLEEEFLLYDGYCFPFY